MANRPTTASGERVRHAHELEMAEKLAGAFTAIKNELQQTIIGQDEVIEDLLICLFSRGHCLIVGVPGLAKSLLVSSLAEVLDLSFSRIQFTPDLMPSDITGTEVIQENKATGERFLQFLPGPVFANVVLADEINRTPPKTQAALLEAMQEHSVTTGGQRRALEEPFFVLSTQNPIEQEGTYPLPEAQLDRFMFNVLIDYPSEEEELKIAEIPEKRKGPALSKVLSRREIIELQDITADVPLAEHVARYALALTRSSRPQLDGAPEFVRQWVQWGIGPRGTQHLIRAAKSRALLRGRFYVTVEDIQAVIHPALRHRIICNYQAEASRITTDNIIDQLLEAVEAPSSGLGEGE